MEPSGNMDGDRLAKDNFIRANFSLCDVADEEVHFSRNVLPIGYGQNNNANSSQPTELGHHGARLPGLHLQSSGLTDKTNMRNQSLAPMAAAEQVKSNKLLHSIGSKLRRGSNYLAAPKLVGKYLLGITIQSWSEFLNTSHLMKAPGNTQQLTRRLLANLNHFQGNYMCVSLILVIYCILTSPLLLVAIIAYLVALYLVTLRSATGRHMRIGGYRPNLQQQYSFITLISLPLLWVAGAPSAVFWVIGASFVVVGLHASMYSGELTGAELTEYHQAPNRGVQTVQYYNDCSTQQQQQQQYISVASPPSATLPPPKESAATSGSSYSSTISQWMMFGGNVSSKHKLALGGSSSSSSSPSSTGNSRGGDKGCSLRVPDVTVISHDYAGLGRVYEV